MTLLTSGQSALSDPLFPGDAVLGLPPFFVSFGFLTDQAAMTMIWNLRFAAILAAHVLALQLSACAPWRICR